VVDIEKKEANPGIRPKPRILLNVTNQATSRTNEKPINVNKNGRMTINMLGRGFWYPQFLVDCQERIDTSIPCSGPWFRRYAELKPLPRRGKHFSDFPRVIGNLELEQELERRSWLDL
jgi:hypothetical protein